MFKFEKIGLGGKKSFRIMNPGTVTVRRISLNACCQPRHPVTANVAVRGNTVYKVILAQGRGIHRRNGYSAVNYQLKD
jgi:hypothetical protein